MTIYYLCSRSFSHSPKQNVKHRLHFLQPALKDKACSDFSVLQTICGKLKKPYCIWKKRHSYNARTKCSLIWIKVNNMQKLKLSIVCKRVNKEREIGREIQSNQPCVCIKMKWWSWDLTTHQSWDRSCHQLQSSYQGRPARRSRPAPAPEGEVVWGGSHCLQARGPPDRCHCSSPESHPAGETWRAAATRTKSTKQSLLC